ncbi:MAG: hypothetical protein ACREUY_08935 [Burkholderiales bacterium]
MILKLARAPAKTTPARMNTFNRAMTGNRNMVGDAIRGRYKSSGMGALSDVTDDLLSLVKSALPIYQQQQVFNQQLKVAQATGQPVSTVNQASTPSTANRTLLVVGGLALAGVLGMMLMKKR